MFIEVDIANKTNKTSCSVVKTNKLVSVLQKLTLSEMRLIQLAIVDARETGRGLRQGDTLVVTAQSYATTFNTTLDNAYKIMLEASENLFDRYFYWHDDDARVKQRWVQSIKYIGGESKKVNPSLGFVFSSAVVDQITNIDGYQDYFTSYKLKYTCGLRSAYSVRLYEILLRWKSIRKTPPIKIDILREQLGLEKEDYPRISNFKARVLEFAIKEINEKTDINVSYEQYKNGRKIIGFTFFIASENNKAYSRIQITEEEALEIAKPKVGESKFDALGRVMRMKDEEGRAKYLVMVDKTKKKNKTHFKAGKPEEPSGGGKEPFESSIMESGSTLTGIEIMQKDFARLQKRVDKKDEMEKRLSALDNFSGCVVEDEE